MKRVGAFQGQLAFVGNHSIQALDQDKHRPEFSGVPISPIPAVNVSQVPQRSPLRYPGGKTWLVPHVRVWLEHLGGNVPLLIEPFAGGGIVSLTAVMEGLARSCLMIELDRDVAAVWHTILASGDELAKRVAKFEPTREAVESLMASPVTSVVDHGFRTLVINRMRRGGILAAGASFSRVGENGKGIASRWYPTTLVKRIEEINRHSSRILFAETDGMNMIQTLSNFICGSEAVLFLDPPYTAGGKRAGSRLYNHSQIDHPALFDIVASCGVNFMMTYDCSVEILKLVQKYGFNAVRVYMKNTHHNRIPELIITNSPLFQD